MFETSHDDESCRSEEIRKGMHTDPKFVHEDVQNANTRQGVSDLREGDCESELPEKVGVVSN